MNESIENTVDNFREVLHEGNGFILIAINDDGVSGDFFSNLNPKEAKIILQDTLDHMQKEGD